MDDLADIKADLETVAKEEGDVLCRAALREIRKLEAAIEALTAENAQLREYAIEVSRTLSDLTTGGSKFFTTNKRFGFYEVNPTYCAKNIRWIMDQRLRLGEARGKALAEQENGDDN